VGLGAEAFTILAVLEARDRGFDVPAPLLKSGLGWLQQLARSDGDTLADERSLVDTARTALSRNDATAALDALAQHERRFPSGQLAEERLALQVLALTRAGRTDDARARAKVFRQKFPSGLFRAVVDDAAPEAP
jgi:hypothetical protein